MPALLILIITFTGLAEGIFIKKYTSKHSVGGFIFTALICFFSMMVFVISDTDGFNFPSEIWIYGIIAGILYCSSSFLTFVALGCGSFALSMLILSYSLVLSIGYGLIFLNEPATVFTYIGLALMMISLYFTNATKKREDVEKGFSLKWLVCISLSVIGSGMFSVVRRMQQIKFDNNCNNEFMIVALGFSTVTLLVIGLIRNGKNLGYILRYGTIWTLGAGASNGVSNALSMLLLTMMPISIASPVQAGVRVVVSFIISIVIFKEKFEKLQVVGVALGAVALVLLNIKI